MNNARMFTTLRRKDSGVFGGSLGTGQVSGVEAIVAECILEGADLGQAAYILATAYGETGGSMRPVRENMNYSASRIPEVFGLNRRQGIASSRLSGNGELLANTVYGGAWGAKNLGNRKGTTDGWDFRGFWIGQITGRHNATKWGENLGVDLLSNPALLDDFDLAVKGLVRPMLEGWATGHALPDYVNSYDCDYEGARRVWNGTFAAKRYAKYARAFQEALEDAEYKPGVPKPALVPVPEIDEPEPNWVVAAIKGMLDAFLKDKS